MTTEIPKNKFRSIAQQFRMNLTALRVFDDRIVAAATEHDRLAIGVFVDQMKELFPEEFLDEDPDATISTSNASSEDGELPSSQSDGTGSHAAEGDPKRVRQVIRAAKSLARAAPIQSTLLRESGLISLIIALEALIADLIHAFYSQFPGALPSEDRSLSLDELRVIGSVEEAEIFLRSKEVDSVLRESLDTQLQYFAKRLKIDLSAVLSHKPFLGEVSQRRNLLVHNRGIVNRTYLERVDPLLIEKYSANKDKKLYVTSDYFAAAMNLVEVAGIVLLQQCWRKWHTDQVDSADAFLVDFTFDALVEQQYEVVIEIAKYAEAVTFKSESRKRRICINHAIALRDSGHKDEIENLLQQYDWSGFQLLFQLALCAVRGQEESFYQLLPRTVAAGEITKENLEEWPLFRIFREGPKFAEALETLAAHFDGTMNPNQVDSNSDERAKAS